MSVFKVTTFNRSTRIESKKNKHFDNILDAVEEAEDIAFCKSCLKTAKSIDILVYQYDFDGIKETKQLVAHCRASTRPEHEIVKNAPVLVC